MSLRTPSAADLTYEEPAEGPTVEDIQLKMRSAMQPFVDIANAPEDYIPYEPSAPAVDETDPAENADIQPEASEDEILAASEGWRPKEEFQGDPDKWVDASTFLDRKPFFAKIREQNDAIKRLSAENAAIQELVQNLVQRDVKNATQELHTQRENILERQKQAFESGDYEAFQQTQQELAQLTAPAAAKTATPEAKNATPPPPAFYKTWEKENASWISVPAARAIGDAAALAVMNDTSIQGTPEAKLKMALAEARKVVSKVYPQYFSNPRKSAPAAVSTGRQAAAPTNVTHNLSPDAMRMAVNLARAAKVPLNQFLANMAKGRK